MHIDLECPFCGPGDHKVVTVDAQGSLAVRCLNCGAYGPETSTTDDRAWELWNTRPAWRPA